MGKQVIAVDLNRLDEEVQSFHLGSDFEHADPGDRHRMPPDILVIRELLAKLQCMAVSAGANKKCCVQDFAVRFEGLDPQQFATLVLQLNIILADKGCPALFKTVTRTIPATKLSPPDNGPNNQQGQNAQADHEDRLAACHQLARRLGSFRHAIRRLLIGSCFFGWLIAIVARTVTIDGLCDRIRFRLFVRGNGCIVGLFHSHVQ